MIKLKDVQKLSIREKVKGVPRASRRIRLIIFFISFYNFLGWKNVIYETQKVKIQDFATNL